ncbi:hypothetical protein MKY66_02250 [Paenibacillus sp. FSL R5-0766]|uniref:hypothetical protein n=1 Tax=unclassified Paenibacillus TaxID=185978 RepID=UPI00096F830D|nr:hypothetical protein [Paenibacillus sp. FSL R5-0765]OMF60472.1 hypothetical protein BK141_23300 [Paenibacillus sp. FSL R5-0765]
MNNYLLILIVLLLLITVITLSVVVFKKLNHLWGELKQIQTNNQIHLNSSIGVNIHEHLVVPDHLTSRSFVCLVASTGCSHCHEAIEELLQERDKLTVPILCLLMVTEETNAMDDFHSKFGNEMEIVEMSMETMWKLKIYSVPYYILVDNVGEIKIQKLTLKATLKSMHNVEALFV